MNVSVDKRWCTISCYVEVTAYKIYPTNHLNYKQLPFNRTSHSVSACCVYVVADAALSRLRVAPPPQDRSRTRLMSGTVSLNNDSEVGGDSPRVRDTVTDQDGSVYSFDTYKQGTGAEMSRSSAKSYSLLNVNGVKEMKNAGNKLI